MRPLALTPFLVSIVFAAPPTAAQLDEVMPAPEPAPAGSAEAGADEKPDAGGGGPELRLYGLIKLDGAYDTARINPGNFARWVELAEGDSDDEFNLTANQSRIGIHVTELTRGSVETEARLEIDFYGGGAENKSRPMLRHAWFSLRWPKRDLELLAGQTSDLFSPLYPNTVNYSVAWWVGNIGYRRPQMRLTKGFRLGKASRFELAGALARTIGEQVSDFAGIDSGADAGLPGVQGRLGWSFGNAGGKPITAFGISGHWAEEEFDVSAEGDAEIFDSWSLNLDFRRRFSERFAIQGEAFRGCNLAAYLGGIGQGVDIDRMEEIFSRGGWLSFDYVPSERYDFHVGGSLEDPDDDDLDAGDRSKNSVLFVNGYYSLTASARFALELSYWQTDYKKIRREDSLRTQFALVYSF